MKAKGKFKTEFVSLEKINRKEAKYYCKNCECCKEQFESKKPLFLLYTKDILITKDKRFNGCFSNDLHIFTLEELNKVLDKKFNKEVA